MGDDKISPSGFLTVAYFYHLGCVAALSLTTRHSSLLEEVLLVHLRLSLNSRFCSCALAGLVEWSL